MTVRRTTIATLALASVVAGIAPVAATAVERTPARVEATFSQMADRLVPEDSVPGLMPGRVRAMPTPGALVRTLYSPLDPDAPAAVARLRGAGYREGALRDQVGTEPFEGIGLLRSYAFRLASPSRARAEVQATVAEVVRSAGGRRSRPSGLPGGQMVEIKIGAGLSAQAIVFVTFPVGRDVIGIQAFAPASEDAMRPAVLAAARALSVRHRPDS